MFLAVCKMNGRSFTLDYMQSWETHTCGSKQAKGTKPAAAASDKQSDEARKKKPPTAKKENILGREQIQGMEPRLDRLRPERAPICGPQPARLRLH